MVAFRGRRSAQCPKCGALERHRVLADYLRARLPPGARVLHFAPEPFLVPIFQALQADYVAADLFPEAANNATNVEVVRADIMDLPFASDTFDVAVVSHVLEHVDDDARAVRELHRVVRPGGRLVAQHPWFPELAATDADPAVTDPQERLRRFGQADHVRKYGPDYFELLAGGGFSVEVVAADEHPGSQIAECVKPLG
jgi:SAM-dependent methyltransferase